MAEMTESTVDPTSRTGKDTPATSLEDLYVRNVPGALRLAYLLTGDRTAAQDLAHEAFVRCAGRFVHLRQPDTFDAYLRKAVVNLHTSGLRRKRLERAWLRREGRAAAETVSRQPEVAEGRDMWLRLQTLPARQRAALVLRFYEDLSERDAAALMGCSVAAVKSLVARGTEALRARIEGEER